MITIHDLTINVLCPNDGHRQPHHRLIPRLGLFREQAGAVVPTPQYQSKVTHGGLLMAVTMSDSQLVTVSVALADKKGNPAAVDGVPEWLTDNSEVLALAPAADGLSCVVSAVGALGTATLSFKADADLGAGVVELAGTLDFTIVAGAATAVTLTPATPTEQP